MRIAGQALLDSIAAHPGAGRANIRRHVARDVSAPTVWRALKKLVDEGRLEVTGKARATGYCLAGAAIVHTHLQTPYNRRKPTAYNKDFIDLYVPNKTYYLGDADRQQLKEAGRPTPPPLAPGTHARRVLERLLVDLSWASSRMEGNTYNILETERLIRFGEEASGKDRKEAVMILNHKEAIQYVVDNITDITITDKTYSAFTPCLLTAFLPIRPWRGGYVACLPVLRIRATGRSANRS